MDLALACDIRVASESARFAETYAKIGLLPGGGGAWFLPRIVGQARALELLWTAEFLDAAQALELGLVNHVYPDADLMEETRKLAARIAAMPPLSIRLIKRVVAQGLNTDMMTSFDLISSHIAIARAGVDHPEAIAAFREKRDGTFTGY
jgi:2-(1,2-epoxy-1,2-dihydrophenyl)acetyl-CoA isomerase